MDGIGTTNLKRRKNSEEQREDSKENVAIYSEEK